VDEQGGSNRSIVLLLLSEQEGGRVDNPTQDFVHYTQSYLDYVKRFLFHFSYWVTLAILFLTGTSRTNLFSMGYLFSCFVFLWFGHKFLVMNIRRLLKMWYFLVMYCYFVLMAKCCLQLVGCVDEYRGKVPCAINRLFTVVCLDYYHVYEPQKQDADCPIETEAQGLKWDAVCFVCLLVMLRVYKSWYFQHVVNDLLIDSQLESRGSELINVRLLHRVQVQKQAEAQTLQRIRVKMQRIRERQYRLNPDLADKN